MLTLLITVILGVIFAVFATQNTGTIPLNFGSYTISGVPIYLAVLLPLALGLLIAFLLHIAKDLSQSLTINEEKNRIKNLKIQLAEITKTAHKLELENTKLKSKNGETRDENSI